MAGTRRSARAQNTESSESTAIPKTRDAIRSSKSTTVAKSPIAPKRVTKSSARLARSRRGGTPPVDEEVADNADNAEVNAQDSKTVGKSKSAGKLAKVIATKGRATRGRGKAAVQEAIDDTVVVTPFGNITGNAETPKRSTRLAKSATLAPVITINSEGSVLEMTEDNARAIGRALRETRRKATNKIGVTKSPISRPPSDRRPTRKGRQSGSSSSKDEYEPAQEEPVKKSRATRTAESIEIESHPTQTYSEEMPQKQEPAKKARTTHGKKAVDPDPQPQVEEVPQEKQEPVKKTRSSRGKKTTKSELPLDLMDVSQDKEEPAKVSRANRGRKAVVSEPQPEVTDASQEKVQEPAKKTRTTREKKLAELESQEQLELPVIHEEVPEQQKPVKARITRGKKNIDPEPQQQPEPKPIKKARSTRAKRSVEPEANLESIVSPDVVSVGQEPTNSRGTRGRKMAEAEAELPVQRQEPIRKTRNKRVNQPTESELEPNKLSLQTKGRQTRPTRGKKAVDTQKVVMEMVPPQIGRPVRKGRRTSAKTAELPAPQPSTPKTPGRKARQSVGPKSVAKNLRGMELDNGDTVHVKTPVGMRIPPPSADESITVAQNGISMELDDHCSSEPLGTIAVRDNDIKPSTAISSSFARHSTTNHSTPIPSNNLTYALQDSPKASSPTTTDNQAAEDIDAVIQQEGTLDNGNVSAEVVVSEPMENEIIMSPSQPPSQSFDADIAKPSTGAVEGDSETQPTNAERDINERVQPNDPEKPLGYNEKSSDLPIRKDSTATSVMSEKSASVDVEETVGLALDLNGIPPTLQGGSSRILGTPQRTRSALARDPVMGTPVMGSTPLGAPITPSFGFGSPLIRDSFTNSPALPSSVGSSRAQSPVKSPSCMPNTPIKVFSPATGATPTSVKSVLTSPSKSSIMDDAQQFTQLSPATSRTVAGSAKSPVKQPPQSSPSAGVHSSPLGLYGVGMPSSPLKRSHDRASSSHHDVPSTLDISTGTSYESLLDSQRELPSPSLNPMVIPAVKSGSPGFSPLKQKHKMPPLESKTEASKLGMNVTSSPVRRTRQSALFDDDEPSRIGILGMAVLSSPVKRSPKVSSEKDSPVNYSSTADGSRPAGYDSLFDDTFSLSPVRVSPQKSVSDDGEELAPMTSLSPNNTPSSKAERPRPVGYDSLFDDTYSLSPVKILQQEAIIEEPSTTKSPKQDVSFPVKESTNNGSTLANVQMSPPKQMASQDIHSESSTRRLPSKRPAGYDSLFDETYSLSPVRITPQKRMLDIADESAALQPSRATSPRKLTPEPLLNVSPPINADLVKVTTSQELVLDGVDEKSTLFKPALGPVVVSNVTSPTKRSPSKRPAGYDSLFDDTYSLTPVRVSPPRQMLLDVAEAESLIQLSPKPVSLVTSPSSAAQGPVSGVASPVEESSPKNTLLDEIHTPQLEDEPPTAQELPKTTPSPAKQPSNSYQGIPSPDQPSPSEKAEMLRPAGYDSLFDETFSLSPVRVTPQKRVLDETDEAPEFGRETHPSPVKHSPKIASVLADDESSRLGLHKMNIPSSPATVLSVSVPETAPQSSPSKRLLPSSPIYRSSSFSPEEAGSAGFDSFDDTACTLSPVRLPPQKTASVLASAGKGSTKLGLQNTPLLQSSPIKQPPIYQPSSPAPPTNDEGSRLELNSMDFSLIEPSSGPTPRGQKSGFVGSTPVRQSSGLFSEDGSPSIPMSAKPTPGYSGGLSVEEPSRFGLDGMTIQSSPVKQPLRTDGESLRPEIGIPSSPPIAGINAYGRMLPGDINDVADNQSTENGFEAAPSGDLAEPRGPPNPPDASVFSTDLPPTANSPESKVLASAVKEPEISRIGAVTPDLTRPASSVKAPSKESPGSDSLLDDSFSPVRLSPLKHPIERPPNPTPTKALARNYELPASSPPVTPERVYKDINESSSSPFQENVAPGTPGSALKVTRSFNLPPSRSPKRRLSYIEVPQAGEGGPSTPPAKRLKENIEVAPDSVSRRRYGRRASVELIAMANEPLMEQLKVLARGYLVRKRIGTIEPGLPTAEDELQKEEEVKSFEILDSFIRKHEEKAKFVPRELPSHIAPVSRIPKLGTAFPSSHSPSPSSPSSSISPVSSSSQQSLKRKAEDTPSPPPQKRKATGGVRKSPRSGSGIRPPTISLAPVTHRPTGPLAWETMLDRERKGLVKKNTKLNCVPTPHKREIERKSIPRPPSPNAAMQTRQAIEGRRKRKAHFLETGIELGPGESTDFEPKMLTPPKKGVRWGAPLESGYSSEPETHSPSQAKGKKVDGSLLVKKSEVALDKFGNLEGASPPKGGSPVVIRKVLYKGEKF